MNNKKVKALSAILAALMLLSTAACSGGGDTSSADTGSTDSTGTNSAASDVSDTENVDSGASGEGNSAVSSGGSQTGNNSKNSSKNNNSQGTSSVIPGEGAIIPTKAPKYSTQKTSGGTVIPKIDTVKGKTITLLCVDYGQFDPNGSANKYLKQYYGAMVKMTKVANDNVVDEYTKAIVSNKPYDLVADCDGFPELVAQDLMQPLDNTIDFTIPEMQKNKEIFDGYSLKGHNYFLPWVRAYRGTIFYNKEIFEDAYLDINGDGKKGDDPYSLYKAGKWNLDTFKKAAQMTTEKNKKGEITTYGLLSRAWTDSKLVYASGQPIAKWNGSKAVSNLNNASYQRIYNDYVSLFLNDKVALRGDDSVAYAEFNKGKGAMLLAPSFCVSGDYFADIFKRQNVGLAPLPKDPNSSTYYVPGSAIGFYVSKGGMGSGDNKPVNVDLINAFINAALASEVDKGKIGSEAYNEARSAFVTKWSAKNKKFTNQWYDDFSKLQKELEETKPFIDPYENCLDLNGMILDAMLGTGNVTPVNFTTAVNKAMGTLNATLDKVNK